jgi:YVTN family beta-propeller protein
VGSFPYGVAVTPDGKHVYVTNSSTTSSSVSVIDTASNTVVATVGVGIGGIDITAWVAFTPDGKHAYVANQSDNTVSVIDTATNTVVATVPVGSSPIAVGIIPPPVINGVTLRALIKSTGTLRYAFQAESVSASFTGTQNAVYVTLAIGGDSGATSVTAMISGAAPSVKAAMSR